MMLDIYQVLVAGTPSEQRAVGEISPPSRRPRRPRRPHAVNVPQSLSHIATAPVPMPCYKSVHRLKQLVMFHRLLPRAQVASPSAQTLKRTHLAQRGLYAVGGLLTLSLCLSAFLIVKPWPGEPKALANSYPTEQNTAKQPDAPAPVALSPQADVQRATESLAPTAPTVFSQDRTGTIGPNHFIRQRRPQNDAVQSVTGKCVSGFAISKASSKRSRGSSKPRSSSAAMTKCHLLGGLEQLKLLTGSHRIWSDVENILKLLLKNNLQSAALPGLVTVRCKIQH